MGRDVGIVTEFTGEKYLFQENILVQSFDFSLTWFPEANEPYFTD